MKDYFLYIFVRILILFFSLLPIRISLWMGRRLGELACVLNKKRKCIAYANLRLAFCKEYPPEKLKRVLIGAYRNQGQNFVELLSLQKIDKKYAQEFISFDGFERVDSALNENKGIALVTAHFGNWELLNVACSLRGWMVTVLARQQKLKKLNTLLNNFRESKGAKLITKGIGARELIKAARNKEIIGILADQDAGKTGTFVDFFGRLTSFPGGIINFALKTDLVILPLFIKRVSGPFHKLTICAPLQKDNVEEALGEYSSILEAQIRQVPEQWLWMHKRWKSSPQRFIIIMNDGKQGHLNQSLAVLEAFKKLLGENLRYKIIDVKFKSELRKKLLSVAALASSSRCQGCQRCLKFCLEEDSYDNLIREYADIVISAGNSNSAVNLFLSYENNAKSIHIMRPSWLGTDRFTMNIIPRHDNPKKRDNIVITKGAPNLIEGKPLKINERPKIGILIGGDTGSYLMKKDLIAQVINEVIKAGGKLDGQFLVTTSRRTPKEIENLAEERFKNLDRCKLLIIANKNNIPNAVASILDSCDILLVSGESISMISEAAASGKYVLVFELTKKARRSRHKIFLEGLTKGGYIKLVGAEQISAAIEDIWKRKPEVKRLDDDKVIFEAVKRII